MTYESGGQMLSAVWSIMIWLPVIAVLSLLFLAIIRFLDHLRKIRAEVIIFEITPPLHGDKIPLATSQLFSVIHGFHRNRSLWQKLARQSISMALEIVSTRKDGIRYLVRIDKDYASILLQSILAYLPAAKVREVDDYIVEDDRLSQVRSYRQARHFAQPIDNSKSINDHDPIAYLAGAMTKLRDDELISFQLVITPAVISKAVKIDHQIRAGSRLKKSSLSALLLGILKLPFAIVFNFTYAVINNELPKSGSTITKPSLAEKELLKEMHTKLRQDLFYSEIRTLIIAGDKQVLKARSKAMANALTTYSLSGQQALVLRAGFSSSFSRLSFRHRLPSLLHSNSCVFGASELAMIYHFPNSKAARPENAARLLSKALPAPVSLKGDRRLDVLLGENHYHGSVTPIGLTESERERHLYIIGGTGNGKTTMLQYQIVQDIKAGKGLAVIDPHGDLATTLLGYIPEGRINDVVYFNPDDIDHSLSMNLLEMTEGLTGSALEKEKDRITESVISVLRKVFSDDDSGGHRIEYLLRNTIQTALTTDDPTIFTIFELLTNDNYRKKITYKLPAGTLKNFWDNEFSKAGAMQRVKMGQGVTSKIGRFEFSPYTKRVMSQPKSTLDFDELIASNKILICNFSKGNLGEDTSALFGTSVLAKLQLAALRRSRLDESSRIPFYLYVDEFQNFATMPFVQMLSEARKYKLFLIMAEQSTAQQDEQRLVNIILANVGTVISFRTGSPADEKLILPLFKPFIDQGEIANLPSYNFYARISAVLSQEPMSGETVVLSAKPDSEIAGKVIAASRKTYSCIMDKPKKFKKRVKLNLPDNEPSFGNERLQKV